MDAKDSNSIYHNGNNSTSDVNKNYVILDYDVGDGFFIYNYISLFLSLITPYDLPLELVRKVLHSDLSFVEFFINAIKIEFGFMIIMTILVILSFIPLGALMSWCCRRNTSVSDRNEPINPLMLIDDSMENSIYCQRRLSICILYIFFAIMLFAGVIMFYTSTKLSDSFDLTPDIIKSSLKDTELFLKDTHSQIKNKLDNGFDEAIEEVKKDLKDIDILLGEPIKIEVSATTGIDLAYDSLLQISSANLELINRIQLLQESLKKALKISQEAAARMEELQIQLSVLQRQCTFRDRPLCDTLRIRSFEENGIIDALKLLQEDQNVFRMKYLGELESDSQVKNLSTEVGISKSYFGNFPIQVKSDTTHQRNETIDELNSIKYKTTTNAELLSLTLMSLVDDLSGTWESWEPHYKIIREYLLFFWNLTLFSSLIIIIIGILIFLALLFFTCDNNTKGSVLMVMGVVVISFASFYLMIYGLGTLTIGGNTEIFLCEPLFDDENFEFMGKLFDKPGYIYAKEKKDGIFGELLKPPDENRTYVNVDLGQVIRECEQNKASYSVFHLDAFVNTEKQSDPKQYPKVTAAINSIHVSEKTLLSLTQSIQNILETMLNTSDLNSTSYRNSISQPTPEKDLATFIDQMQRVSLQIQDVATSSRMTTLGSRAKRLQASILQPLEQLRNEILYHLTALELQKDPWRKHVNQTLNHLKNIQKYLENTAGEICKNQTRIYTKRLKDYLALDKNSVTTVLSDKTALCRPLFDVFNVNRNFMCHRIVDSINGLWFCIFVCLFLWSIGTPIGLNLITMHTKLQEIKRIKKSSRRLSDTEGGNWRSTRNESPRTPRTPRVSQTPSRQQGRSNQRLGSLEVSLSVDEEDGNVSGYNEHQDQNSSTNFRRNMSEDIREDSRITRNARTPRGPRTPQTPSREQPTSGQGRIIQRQGSLESTLSVEEEAGNVSGYYEQQDQNTSTNFRRNMSEDIREDSRITRNARTPRGPRTPQTPSREQPTSVRSRPNQRLGSLESNISLDEDEVTVPTENENTRNIRDSEYRDPREPKNMQTMNVRDIGRQVTRGDSRAEYRIPRAPPVPPHPPPVPAPDYMTRQNSVRGVRWDRNASLDFEDAE